MEKIKAPFNLNKWIENNKHLLKPPVGNKNLYIDSEDFIVMIVAGPNARKDYHYNETEELFYQIEGDIIVKTQQNGKMVEVKIREGEMFLLPAKKKLATEPKKDPTNTQHTCGKASMCPGVG